MYVRSNNDPEALVDEAFTVRCPDCGAYSGITAISLPRFELLNRYRPAVVAFGYKCDACDYPIHVRLTPNYAEANSANVIRFDPSSFEQVEQPQETYEFGYLPELVADDFREALICYSDACYNAFAAMCRRTIQSSLSKLGAEGKSKVGQQLKDAKAAAGLDDETYTILEQIVIAGHDGAHPNLPRLKPDRAAILLELMKDVLYQLFVRRKKLEEAVNLRKQTIEEEKQNQQ